jgi:hypothetical protein
MRPSHDAPPRASGAVLSQRVPQGIGGLADAGDPLTPGYFMIS